MAALPGHGQPRQGASTCRGRRWKAGTAWADGKKSPCGLCNCSPPCPRLPREAPSHPRGRAVAPGQGGDTEGHSLKGKQIVLSDCLRSSSGPKVLNAPKETGVPCKCSLSPEACLRHSTGRVRKTQESWTRGRHEGEGALLPCLVWFGFFNFFYFLIAERYMQHESYHLNHV